MYDVSKRRVAPFKRSAVFCHLFASEHKTHKRRGRTGGNGNWHAVRILFFQQYSFWHVRITVTRDTTLNNQETCWEHCCERDSGANFLSRVYHRLKFRAGKHWGCTKFHKVAFVRHLRKLYGGKRQTQRRRAGRTGRNASEGGRERTDQCIVGVPCVCKTERRRQRPVSECAVWR